MFAELDEFAERYFGDIEINRSRRMVLDPLTEIVIGVFMAVGVGSGQFVMDILRNGKRREGQQQNNKTTRQADF